MGRFTNGFEEITVNLLDFKGNDLAKHTCKFGALAEFYEGAENLEYDPEHPHFKKVVDEIIHNKTFPKYALEGHNVTFQINNISRICLAQLTREKGFFCSQSGGTRPLTQEFVTPLSIKRNDKWMRKLEDIQSQIESLYVEMCEAGIPYLDSRYFGFHAQTISLTYNCQIGQWLKSCNTRTENNFADEINYIYRLMYHELRKAIDEQVTDPLSKRLWEWLLSFADKKSFYSREHTYNNDFQRYPTPAGYDFGESSHNNWVKSGWKLELERMYNERPYLLFPGEVEMIESWTTMEEVGIPLPTTYDSHCKFVPESRIKTMPYYKEN